MLGSGHLQTIPPQSVPPQSVHPQSITLLSVGATSSRCLWFFSHLTLLLLPVSISLLELSQMGLAFCSISFDISSAVDSRETCQLLRSIPDLPKGLCSLARNVIVLLCGRDFSLSYLGEEISAPIPFPSPFPTRAWCLFWCDGDVAELQWVMHKLTPTM